jgi:hypothetical protein
MARFIFASARDFSGSGIISGIFEQKIAGKQESRVCCQEAWQHTLDFGTFAERMWLAERKLHHAPVVSACGCSAKTGLYWPLMLP